MSKRNFIYLSLAAIVFVIAATIPTKSLSSNGNSNQPLIAGRNVNMVAGQTLPDGDPFLQRQNEPSLAVSTRNPLHILAGANDYRSVGFAQSEGELPGQEPSNQLNSGDAWLGVFKSFNGGLSWISSLLPGNQYYDTTPSGAPVSPILGLGAAADPTVRAGANGMFYYSGIAFDRILHGQSILFISRYMDINTTLIGDSDPIKYIDTTSIDSGTSGQFTDKPWIAVDIPRDSANRVPVGGVDIPDQYIPAHNVYIAYSVFLGSVDNLNVHNKILFARSLDCGNTWNTPIKLSEGEQVNQGTIVAVSPEDGTVYVAWRRFASGNVPGAILICKSEDFGYRFNKPVEITILPPVPDGAFDQGTTPVSFRTSALPALAVDHNGTVYVAWSERQQNSEGESRIMISTSIDGENWSDPESINAPEGQAHQIMPSLSFASGRLMLTWYDTRKSEGGYEFDIADPGVTGSRHTMDVWAAKADPIDPLGWSSSTNPSFTQSTQVSRYLYWAKLNPDGTIQDPLEIIQAEFNPPNYPMFKGGEVPFHGDYIDITPSPLFLPDQYADGGWRFNTGYTGVEGEEWKELDPSNFHIAWTDNRDVRPPLEGLEWTDYVHPGTAGCLDDLTTGMRDQNVYTSQLTQGVIIGAPVNAKPLIAPYSYESNGVQKRTFLVFVKNLTDTEKYFRLTMETPDGMQTSFWEEWPLDENDECPFILCDEREVWLPVASHSSITLTVFVLPFEDILASFKVKVEELMFLPEPEPQGSYVIDPDGFQSYIILNPDPINTATIPSLDEYHTPSIITENPIIDVFFDPTVLSDEYAHNPEIADLLNFANPDIVTPSIRSPSIRSYNVLNPSIRSPSIRSIPEGTVTDIQWEVTNDGNVTSAFSFVPIGEEPPTIDDPDLEQIQYQLLVYRVSNTPISENCLLADEEHHDLILKIENPSIRSPSIRSPSIRSPSIRSPSIRSNTFFLAPGEEAVCTLRVIDPNSSSEVTGTLQGLTTLNGNGGSGNFNPNNYAKTVSGVAIPQAFDPNGEINVAAGLFITNETLPDGTVGEPYLDENLDQILLEAFGGSGTYVDWWIVSGMGDLPDGLYLTYDTDLQNWVIGGTPLFDFNAVPYAHTYRFTVAVEDSAGDIAYRNLSITVHCRPFTITATTNGAGSISPPGVTSVDCGTNQVFTIEPGDCHYIEDVLVDGVSVGPVTSYTFYGDITDVTAPHTIHAEFEPIPYRITASATSGGRITPSGEMYVPCGSNQTFDIEVTDPCYFLADVLLNGTSLESVDPAGMSYAIEDVRKDYTIHAIFTPFTYTITATASFGGSIDPSGAVEINCGLDQQFTITADDGFVIWNVFVDGAPQGALSAYKFTNVTEDHTIDAKFEKLERWVRRYNNPLVNGDDAAADIAADFSSGNVYVTGYSTGYPTGLDFYTIGYDRLGAEGMTARYDGPAHLGDLATAVDSDNLGNIYVTGYSYRGMQYKHADYCTVKYNSAGELVWDARYDARRNGNDQTLDIVVHPSGILVTGKSEYSLSKNSDQLHYDYFTVKYEPEKGEILWEARYNNDIVDGEDVATALAVDDSGNVYVTGYSFNGTDNDIVTIKYDANTGAQLWADVYDAGNNDEAVDIGVDSSGNVYITGYSSNGTHHDIVTIKYDSTTGARQWTKVHDGGNEDKSVALAIHEQGGDVYIHVTGYSHNGSDNDYVTIQYKDDGVTITEEWVKTYNNEFFNGSDEATALAVDSLGNVIVTGKSEDASTGFDYYTIVYDNSGSEIWFARYSTPGNYADEPTALAVDAIGNVFVAGKSNAFGTLEDFVTIMYEK